MREKLARPEKLRREYELGSGQVRLGAQHQRGELSLRERLDLVLDDDLRIVLA
jgi:propionyl-CoA carboxylase beta chain